MLAEKMGVAPLHPEHPAVMSRDEIVAQLIRAVVPRGLRIAARLVGTADAEDAVQEALMRTCLATQVRDLEGWFLRVLVNHCIGVQRRRRIWRALGLARVDEEPDIGPAADDRLGLERAAREVREHVDRLPAMQRTVVQLRFGEELSLAEIARVLDIGDETVKTHLQRALRRLRIGMGRP